MAEIVPNRVPCCKKTDPQPTPTPDPKPVVVLCELSGVTYFKLRSDISGDFTKNCGLLGEEIDRNFYFLRSMDIQTAYTVNEDNKKYLILQRVNCGRDIKIDITDEEVVDKYMFRVENGYIYVRYPNGTEDQIRDGNGEIGDGKPVRFLVEGENVRVATDATINGDGLHNSPISLDPAYRTGTYMPADFYADLTCPEETINQFENIGHGHAIVTKENMGRFGALYTFDQAEAINEAVEREGRGWRLPSKDDWAALLNWAEEKDEDRTHDTDRSGNFGCVAGARLKTTVLWVNSGNNTDDFDFSVYPVGQCPETRNAKEPEDYGFMDLYRASTFWTSTEKDGEVYTRRFSYGHDDVYQGTESPACRFSIRLVRDIEADYDIQEFAEILGNYCPVVLTTDGKQQWTQLNIDFTNYSGYNADRVTVPQEWKDIITDETGRTYYKLDGKYQEIPWYEIPSNEEPKKVDEVPENPAEDADKYIYVEFPIHIDMETEPKFFFNAWDGYRWHKKMMKEGESVVILGEDFDSACATGETPYVQGDNKNHEWRVFINPETGLDELIDTAEALKREMMGEIIELREAISGLTDDLAALSGFVESAYDEMQSGFTSAFTAIDEEISARTAADEELWEALSAETAERIAADDELIAMIEAEASARTAADENLQKQIDEEVSARTAADEELQNALNEEISARTAADEELWEALSAETAERIAADEELQEQVDELKKKTIEPLDVSIVVEVSGYTTYVGVQLDPEDKHIKLGENGLWFDGDFGTEGDSDE